MSEFADDTGVRHQLVRLLAFDLRRLTTEYDRTFRSFAAQNDLANNDFRTVLLIVLAETSGGGLAVGDLPGQIGLSGAAITNIVDRLAGAGHIRREADSLDGRRTLLRSTDRGINVVREFMSTMQERLHGVLGGLTDADLEAAHRTFVALLKAGNAFSAEIERDSTTR